MEKIKSKGTIEIITEYLNGSKEKKIIHNTVLQGGREALANSLADNFGASYNYFINEMVFGTNGVDSNSVPLYVPSSMNGLFGSVLVGMPVVSNIDPNNSTSVIFTSVLPYGQNVGATINEMGLVMANNVYYSMATFPNITIGSNMQITWNWTITFV